MPKIAKTLPYILHGSAFYKIVKFVLTKKGYQKRIAISITKVSSDLKVNWQRPQPMSYKVNFSLRDNIHLADHKKENLSKCLGES